MSEWLLVLAMAEETMKEEPMKLPDVYHPEAHSGSGVYMNGGLPLMGVPLGADHPPGGCPQQPRQVVSNDRPAELSRFAAGCSSLA